MKSIYTLLIMLIIALPFQNLSAQTIPTGACGLQYTYDASGNLLQRQYVCVTAFRNNSSDNKTMLAKTKGLGLKAGQTASVQPVEVLYTQKSTGSLSLRFDKALNKVPVRVLDKEGKQIQSLQWDGETANMDLSGLVAGQYRVEVQSPQLALSQKVVKL